MTLHEYAIGYRDKMNLSIIPVGPNKKPLIKWQEFQERRPDIKEIDAWYKKFPNANIGIVTGKLNDLAVIDIDHDCGYGELTKYIPNDILYPISTTPRGGQHWWFRLGDQPLRNNVSIIPGTDLRAEGGFIVAPPSVLANGQYSWQKDKSPKNIAFPPIPQLYCDAVSQLVTRCHTLSQPCHTLSHDLFQVGQRDEDLFSVANALIKGNMHPEKARQVLRILADFCKFDDNSDNKITSALERAARRDRNLKQEILDLISVTSCDISVTDCDRALQLVTKQEKANLRQILHRLTAEKVLQKHSSRGGVYRIVEDDLQSLDWKNAGTGEFDIKLPLDMHNYVKIQPKNIIIVAGASNSGKTAFLFNIVIKNIKNKEKKRIKYFSSEMSEQEFKGRVQGFGLPLERWDFDAYERCGNFADVIDPNAINIIDFLELHEDFWKVGSLIKEIYDKLDTGIAIIALQKNSGSKLGRGGAMSIEKARLYIGMDFGKIWIEKGKNWRHETINPNGLTAEFKLAKGAEFLQVGNWHYEDEKGNHTCDAPCIERDVEDYFT